ncbi:hypothetical protein GS982_32040 [Rhodococcus hoagii]|nr:hypothetical protein [Prescottella equi]
MWQSDCHIYATTSLRSTRSCPRAATLPTLELDPVRDSIFDYRIGDAVLVDYRPHPAIPAPVAV